MAGMTIQPAQKTFATMDELLSGYEKDMQVPTEEDAELSAKMAQEVNLLKQASSQQMDLAFKSELSLQHNGSIVEAMDRESCMRVIEQIKIQKEKEIAAIKESDPRHNTKVREIKKRAQYTLYKAMKKINARNEKIPAQSKIAI